MAKFVKDALQLSRMSKEDLILAIINWGCDCEIMNGWNCGHTYIYDELQKRIKEEKEK